MPEKAKAAVLTAFNKPLEIKEFPIPKIGPNAILARMEAAGICGTDVHLWRGRLKVPLPMILGHEFIARVEGCGQNRETDSTGTPLKEGDRVTWTPSLPCGRCYFCMIMREPTRCLNRHVYGIVWSSADYPHLRGGYAQYVYLDPETAVFKIPDDVPSDRFLALGCGLPTMIHGMERIGGVRIGETVVVQGSGPVGIAAALISRRSGASRIIVVGGPEPRLQLIRDLGAADHTIDIFKITDPDRRVEEIKQVVKFGGDVVIEATGVPSAVQEGINMTRDSGRYLVVGQYSDRGPTPINPHYITRKQIVLGGSWGFSGRHTYEALRFVQETNYPLEKLISYRFPLEKATEALEMMEKATVVKVVILPW